MAEKIKYKDVVDGGDWFKDAIKSTEVLLSKLGEVSTSLKAIGDQSKVSIKTNKLQTPQDVAKMTQETNKLKQTTEQLSAVEKERLRLEGQLKQARSIAADDNAELNILLSQQKKINTDLAKEKLGLVSAYDKENKVLNDLKKQYRDLYVQGKANTDQGKALKAEIDSRNESLKKLSRSLGEGNRDVGIYERATDGLKGAFLRLTVPLAAAFGATEIFKKAIESSGELTDKWEKAIITAKSAVSVFFNTLVSGDFTGFTQKFRETIAAAQEYADVIDLVNDKEAALNVQRAETRLEVEKLMKQVRNVGLSDKERIAAIDKIIKLEEEDFKYVKQIAKERQDATIKAAAATKGLSSEQTKFYFQTFLQNQAAINKAKEFIKVQDELKQQQAASTAAQLGSSPYGGIGRDLDNIEETSKKINARLKTLGSQKIQVVDENGKILSYTVQAFANITRKAEDLSNEQKKLINDALAATANADADLQASTKRVEARRAALLEAIKKADKKQMTYLEQQQATLAALQKKREDYANTTEAGFGIDRNKLDLLNKQIDAQQRLIKELEIALGITKDAQKTDEEFFDIRLREHDMELAIQQDGLQAYKDYLKDKKSADEFYFEYKKRKELELAKLEYDAIKKSFEDANKARADAIKKQNEEKQKRIEDLKQAGVEGSKFIVSIFEEASKRREEILKNDLEASKNFEATLRALAAARTEGATENLAFEQKRQAEIRAQEIEETKKQERYKLIIAGIELLTAKAKSGDGNALSNTIGQIATFVAALGNIKAFEEGGLVEGGDQIVRINEKGQEFVAHAEATRKYMPILEDMNRMEFNPVKYLPSFESAPYEMAAPMIERLDKIEAAIKGKRELDDVMVDKLGHAVVYRWKEGNTITENHVKSGIGRA